MLSRTFLTFAVLLSLVAEKARGEETGLSSSLTIAVFGFPFGLSQSSQVDIAESYEDQALGYTAGQTTVGPTSGRTELTRVEALIGYTHRFGPIFGGLLLGAKYTEDQDILITSQQLTITSSDPTTAPRTGEWNAIQTSTRKAYGPTIGYVSSFGLTLMGTYIIWAREESFLQKKVIIDGSVEVSPPSAATDDSDVSTYIVDLSWRFPLWASVGLYMVPQISYLQAKINTNRQTVETYSETEFLTTQDSSVKSSARVFPSIGLWLDL